MQVSRLLSCLVVFLTLIFGSVDAHPQRSNSLPPDSLQILDGGACGYRNINVERGVLAGKFDICQPLSDVMAYFRKIGFNFEPRFSLTVTSRRNTNYAAYTTSYGIFDAAKSKIIIFRKSERTPWGLPRSKELFASVVVHEMVHMAISAILGSDNSRLSKEWHEFIAYAVQIETLDHKTRDSLLEKFSGAEPFDNLLLVNPYIYGLTDPQVFSVRAYKTYRAYGGSRFARKLLRLEFRPPAFLDIFPLEQR